jgi:hypothetical protein
MSAKVLMKDRIPPILTCAGRSVKDDTLGGLDPHFLIVLGMRKRQLNRFLLMK